MNKLTLPSQTDQILVGDCMALLADLPDNCIDLVVTDPPYFLDKMANDWDHDTVHDKHYQDTGVVSSLPAGMKFSRAQGVAFYDFYIDFAREIFRVLKPGGFFFSFSAPRLYHRMASAVDDAGFEIRDMFTWLYTQNQVKAMSLDHFVRRMDLPASEKKRITDWIKGWKTPQIKSCFEPIVMGQKPTEGTFLANFLKYGVGLFNLDLRIGSGGDMFPANTISTEPISEMIDRVFLIGKPSKAEKGEYNHHQTVKPLAICSYLISLSTRGTDAIILDPFIGSGTTAVAAALLGRHYIGYDLNEEYVEISVRRIKEALAEQKAEGGSGSE
jgi:site-specific DNA-methyltransferase (adenine-specific)